MKRIPWTFVFPFDNGGETSVTGYTPLPEKGVDYYTPADQESIVQQVITALGTPMFGRVEADNTIIFTSNSLANGTYTLKFEDEEGVLSEMCEWTLGGVEIINWIPRSTDTDGVTIYNGQGWKEHTRINSSGVIKEQSGYELTGFIPFTKGDVLRGNAGIIGLIAGGNNVSNTGYNVISLFNSSRTFIANVALGRNSDAAPGVTFYDDDSFVFDSALNADVTSSVAFIRVTAAGITSSSILTVNQEIT